MRPQEVRNNGSPAANRRKLTAEQLDFTNTEVGTMKQTLASRIGIMLVLALAGLPAGAQQNQTPSGQQATPAGPSLGEYARHVRKEPETKVKPKVFDNDNLPKE